jgi:hypothetical protein
MITRPKFGIVFCAYNEEKWARESLAAFVDASKRHDMLISVVSVPFLEYADTQFICYEDNTVGIMREFLKEGKIQALFDEPRFIQESQARNICLEFLMQRGCSYIFIVDADELYSQSDIDNIIRYVEQRPEVDYFKVDFKNYVFDGNAWITETYFPRIFKTDSAEGIAGFYWDNDVLYNDGRTYKQLSCCLIPEAVAFVKHMSWTNDKGERKVAYQMKHFGLCSYVWNSSINSLEFNQEYYRQRNEPLPQLKYN